jgi:hypothetical protein
VPHAVQADLKHKAHAVLWRLFEILACDLFDCLFLLLMAQIRKLLGLPQMSLDGLLRFLILLLRAESAESVGHQRLRQALLFGHLRKSFRPMVLADLWPHICSFNPHAPAAHQHALPHMQQRTATLGLLAIHTPAACGLPQRMYQRGCASCMPRVATMLRCA